MLNPADLSSVFRMMEGIGQLNLLQATEYPADPYALCWCGSSKKWKFCHKLRSSQRAMTFGELLQKQLHHYRNGPCLHPRAGANVCSSEMAIRSHTVQRNGSLSAVAEQGHVYSTKAGVMEIEKNEGEIVLKLVGLKEASTFPGFCNSHDTEIFRPVEVAEAVLDERNAFLLSYRAICYEHATKKASIAAAHDKREWIDAGYEYSKQVVAQNFLHSQMLGMQKGVEDTQGWKNSYDMALADENYSSFSLYGLKFDRVLPFAVAVAFMPEFDFAGRKMQQLGTHERTDHVAVNVACLGGTTVATFCWKDNSSDAGDRFMSSFLDLPDDRKAEAVLLLAFEYSENIYLRPSWWDSLPVVTRTFLETKIVGGTYGRDALALTLPAENFMRAEIVNVLDLRR